MANVFVRSKNYANAFFMYFTSLGEYAQLYVSKKLNVELDARDAIEFLSKSKRFSFTPEGMNTLFAKKEEVSMRHKMERTDCDHIKKYVMSLRKAL